MHPALSNSLVFFVSVVIGVDIDAVIRSHDVVIVGIVVVVIVPDVVVFMAGVFRFAVFSYFFVCC